MRKTSQDGGDSTSITSIIENDIKKPGALLKCKRNSIKRKVQSLSHESDDTVIEPLLQKEKEKTSNLTQSAKYNLLSKTKTDVISERASDKDILSRDDKSPKSVVSNITDVTDSTLSTSSTKENAMSKFTNATAPLHNYMNTNVFSSHDAHKGSVVPKNQILVKIDGSKQVGYNPSPLIFTTAKIHTDGSTKHMEPVQVTPVPILSTTELSILKDYSETSALGNSDISTVYTKIPKSNIIFTDNDQKLLTKTIDSTSISAHKTVHANISTDKMAVQSNTFDKNSTSIANKETKVTQSINTHGNITAGNKAILTDLSMSSMPEKSKSTIQNESVTKGTLINDFSKGNGTVNKEYETTKAKTETSKYSEKKTDLNMSVKPDSIDSLKSKVSDNGKSQNNTLDKTFSSRQLQRQNIVTEESIPKLISSNDPNVSNKSADCLATAVETAIEIKSPANKINNLDDTTIMPKLCANSVPVTGATTLPMITSSALNKSSASVTTAAAINKIHASATTATAIDKINTPITKSTINNKTLASTTTSVSVKKSVPTTTSSAAFNKTSALITTVADINKTSTLTTTTAVINKKTVPTTNNSTIKKSPTPVTTAENVNKTSASINTTSAFNINATTMNTIATIKSSAPLTTTGNKTSIPSTSTATDNKPSGPLITSPIIDKITAPNNTTAAFNTSSTILSDKSTTASSAKPKSFNTSLPKPVVATSSRSIGSTTTSDGAVKSDTKNKSSIIKPQVSSTINSKPLSTITSAKSTNVNPNVTSLPTKSTKTISQETFGKSVDNTTKSSTSNVKPSIAKSTIPVSSAVAAAHGTSSGLSSKSNVSNKQNDSKLTK